MNRFAFSDLIEAIHKKELFLLNAINHIPYKHEKVNVIIVKELNIRCTCYVYILIQNSLTRLSSLLNCPIQSNEDFFCWLDKFNIGGLLSNMSYLLYVLRKVVRTINIHICETSSFSNHKLRTTSPITYMK